MPEVSETVKGIFEPPWYFAIDESKLKEETPLSVRVEDREVLLIKKESRIYAFSNICPHARCPLDRGKLDDYILQCLCHGRKFDIRTGDCLNDSLELVKYEWKLAEGNIGVKIEG